MIGMMGASTNGNAADGGGTRGHDAWGEKEMRG